MRQTQSGAKSAVAADKTQLHHRSESKAAAWQSPVAWQAPLRSPDQVMRLNRLGSFHQSRLSFLRVLLRRMANERWQLRRTHWRVDACGVGTAVYEAKGPVRTYSLIAFARALADEDRSDRVIATAWDASFALFDGVPTEHDLQRLSAQVPLQEAGRITRSEITLSRANRSVRVFDHVRQALASGQQPDSALLDETGYLMRTTAVYGSGKFGALDHRFLRDRQELAMPFQAEMLTVYLIRQFTFDIVEHLAAADSPESATTLSDSTKRALGVGNATGLGMAPFLINHPALFNNWILARETALQQVRSLPQADVEAASDFSRLVSRAQRCANHWSSTHERQQQRITQYRQDLSQLANWLAHDSCFDRPYPWNAIFSWAQEQLSVEGQEAVVSLLLEPHGDIVDELASMMHIDESEHDVLDGAMTVSRIMQLVEAAFPDALATDFGNREQTARFWYVSADKLEPRLGERYQEPGAARESPLAAARDAAALYAACQQFDSHEPIARLVLKHPELRHAARRIQALSRFPYAEIQDNLIAASMQPIDMLRCKLSFFGANHFDPKSDRWVRITLARHAPLMDELASASDDWIYPPAA
ncbi:MAG: hypothetical protein AB8C46_21195 [Burkholderiaceae bacterium]